MSFYGHFAAGIVTFAPGWDQVFELCSLARTLDDRA